MDDIPYCTFCSDEFLREEAGWIIEPEWKTVEGNQQFGKPDPVPVCQSCYDAFRRAADYPEQTFTYERV